MYWLLQSNVSQAGNFDKIIEAVSKHAEYRLVKTIPFTDIIIDHDVDINDCSENDIPNFNIDDSLPIMTMGSYTLAKIAKQRGWYPASDLISDTFNFDNLKKQYGCQNLLNGPAIIGKLGDIEVPSEWNEIFARPVEDTKSFAGQVFSKKELTSFINTIIDINEELLNKDTPIVVAPVQEIMAEYRLFVVDGEIVAGSLYRAFNRSKVLPIFTDNTFTHNDINQEDACIEFAKDMLDIYQPAKAFVLDIAITLFGPKIIEVNNINSSGFYASDIEAVVVALNKL